MESLRRYYQTLRWLRWRQVHARLMLFLRRKTDPMLFPARLRCALRREEHFLPFAPHIHDGQCAACVPQQAISADAILGGEFRFASLSQHFPGAPDWSCSDPTKRFWYYNLHYFEYGPALARAYLESGNSAYFERLRALMLSWIENNPPGSGFGWDGGPLSQRIAHWCEVAFLLATELEAGCDFAGVFKQSLFAQALYLETHLEYHLGGNHLVANGLALLSAGTLFEGIAGTRWRRRGLRILEEELGEQVLSDGGHYERSPMYHAIVLEHYLRALRLLRATGTREPPAWREKLILMTRFLTALNEPDGEFPLLNDAALGIARPTLELIEEAENLLDIPDLHAPPTGVALFPRTGLYIVRTQEQDFFVFDAGPVGPDCNPGHAHSDTLGFELALAGHRVVVDSGTFSYAADPWREYCQSTRAHNTVMLDGVEQTEKWGPWHFRAARRAKPVDVVHYEHEALVCFQGSHTGYDHLPGKPRHMRRVLLVQGRYWIIYDEIRGTGAHIAESFLHFHPHIPLSREAPNWQAAFPGGSLCVVFFGDGAAECMPPTEKPPQGWYCPEFGLRLPQPVLRATVQGRLPLRFGWALLPGVRKAQIKIETKPDGAELSCQMDNLLCHLRQMPDGRFHLDT